MGPLHPVVARADRFPPPGSSPSSLLLTQTACAGVSCETPFGEGEIRDRGRQVSFVVRGCTEANKWQAKDRAAKRTELGGQLMGTPHSTDNTPLEFLSLTPCCVRHVTGYVAGQAGLLACAAFLWRTVANISVHPSPFDLLKAPIYPDIRRERV